MSVQKLVSEADKLFEKGKVPEGIAKLKAALSTEPLNQLVATKLATVFVQNGETLEAAKVYSGLAKRLSEAGKSSVAIAIFKQALELTPDDIALRLRYAVECESVGKLGDAFLQGQIVLNYYLRRKKFFDASNILPLMARAQPKDDKIKLVWIDVMQLCQTDQKLVSLLVALCGPPGVASPDFPVGGDPLSLTPVLYEGLKKLVPYYPRDGKIAYAVAWSAYRRGRKAEMYHYLRECLRREPDFCLAILLFARSLAEDQRLNEAMFLYRYYKERMAADKTADMLTLNRQLETFVEKNGWIKFTEESGDLLDTGGFYKALTGAAIVEKKEESAGSDSSDGSAENERAEEQGSGLPPAEIEIGLGSSGGEAMEILTATGQSIQEASKQKKSATPGLTEPMRMQAELIKATVEAAVAGMGTAAPQQPVVQVQPVVLPVIQAAAMQASAESVSKNAQAIALAQGMVNQAQSEAKKNPPAESAAPPEEAEEVTGAVEGFTGESVEFTSLIKLNPGDVAAAPAAEEKTPEAAPPAEVAPPPAADAAEDAAEDAADDEEAAPKKKLFNPFHHSLMDDAAKETPSVSLEERDERTQMFTPIDVLGASNVMQNREIGRVGTKKIEAPAPAPDDSENDKTQMSELRMGAPSAPPVEEAPQAAGAGDATVIMKRPEAASEPPTISLAEHSGAPLPAAEAKAPEAQESPSEAPAFMPIPVSASSEIPNAGQEDIDLGDDLLEGPTRIFTPEVSVDKTEHLLKEIKQDLKAAAGERPNVELLLKKADRFTAKRNYYLARKALRHAQALGADEERVKERLREIRKLEFPEGMYNTMSSDQPASKVDTSEVLERLELEFDLTEGAADTAEMSAVVDQRIEAIFRENDARTILDFGVGLHEMGLFRQAESLFIRVVEDFPDFAFDAYYLAAVSKLSRRDYAGAASILKRLSGDTAKTDLEKIQIYYALGETFEKMRQHERSKKFFEKVAELDANYRNIRHKLDG